MWPRKPLSKEEAPGLTYRKRGFACQGRPSQGLRKSRPRAAVALSALTADHWVTRTLVVGFGGSRHTVRVLGEHRDDGSST